VIPGVSSAFVAPLVAVIHPSGSLTQRLNEQVLILNGLSNFNDYPKFNPNQTTGN
jgi:hypothetical protein